MSHTQLHKAQALTLPSREATLNRSPSVQEFWQANSLLLETAWQEWDESETPTEFVLDESLIDEKLRNAVNAAWQDPTQEDLVRALWQEVSPGVYHCQFFDPDRLSALREYLEKAYNADIPVRAPYGIVLNRGGAMLDPRSEGYLAAPSFQAFYRQLIDVYMRPIARMLFPEITGDDHQTFGFSIKYQANIDTSLRLHTDASAVTLNINMNLPDETYTGSEVDFLDKDNRKMNRISFAPGTATIHRGHVPHAAQPITSGERSNLVLWLYGERGFVVGRGGSETVLTPSERWKIPQVDYDNYAPF